MATQVTSNLRADGGSGALRILVPTVSDKSITDFGTVIDLTGVTAIKPKYANKRKATEFETIRTNKGVDVRVAKRGLQLDAVAGDLVAAGDAKDGFEFSFYASTSQLSSLEDVVRNSNQPLILIWSEGDAAGNLDRDIHFLGYVEGDLEEDLVEGVHVHTLTVNGGVAFTDGTGDGTPPAQYIGVYKTTPGDITPDGFQDDADNITFEDVVAQDLTNLLKGELVKVTRA